MGISHLARGMDVCGYQGILYKTLYSTSLGPKERASLGDSIEIHWIADVGRFVSTQDILIPG